jgi:hypothetical protein
MPRRPLSPARQRRVPLIRGTQRYHPQAGASTEFPDTFPCQSAALYTKFIIAYLVTEPGIGVDTPAARMVVSEHHAIPKQPR